MALPASDNFNRPDELLLDSPNWALGFNSGGAALEIVSQQLRCNTVNQWACCYWAADTFSASHRATLTILNDNNSGGPAVRVGGGDCIYLDNFGTTLKLYHYNGAAFTTLASVTGDYAAFSDYTLDAIDEGGGITRVIAYEDGVEIPGLNVTTSALTGGASGAFVYSDTIIADNWVGDDITGSTPVSQTFTTFIEAAGYIAANKQSPHEAMQSIQAPQQVGVESLTSLSQTRTTQYECNGSAVITVSYVVPIEQAGYTVNPHGTNLEALQSRAVTRTIAIEAQHATIKPLTLQFESVGFAQRTGQAKLECAGNITAESVAAFENLQNIGGAATLSIEVLQTIAQQTGVSIEAIRGGTVNALVNIIERTVYFSLQIDRNAQVADYVDKTIM